ncbi:MAG: hypothetical protein R8J94_14830 [Acidimicrobiia bacterium]|nr:hypothetical protein [Acidimicrobiia bacterium]
MKKSATFPALALAVALATGCSSTSEPHASVANSDATVQPSRQATDLTGITFEVFRDPG